HAPRATGGAPATRARANPAPGRHLAATIRTGRYCAYTPDPRPPRLGALTRAIGPGLNAGAPGLNAHPAVRMRTRLDDPTTWKEAPRCPSDPLRRTSSPPACCCAGIGSGS